MKQILQNMGSGETSLVTAPAPQAKSGNLLIHTTTSLISAGTERMLVEFGQANFIQKARKQPDKVKMVLDKVKTDGLATTIDAVKSKLDQQNILSLLRVHADSGRLGGLLKMWLSSPESLGREGFDLDALLSEIQDNQKNMRDIIQLL